MTARELGEWSAFERIYGPLTVQERVDYSSAFISAGLSGGDPNRYVPKWDAASGERKEQTPEELMAFMRGLQRRRRRPAPPTP